jgi:hypothetical protein
MTTPVRFTDSVYDRIGSYLPTDQREMFFRYVAHLRTLDPGDSLLVLAEGMAVFTCLSRQVPEALGIEREKLLTEFARLCSKHEAATKDATANVGALFAAQQKLLEQNISTWQNREQEAVQSLGRIAKRFEETANHCVTRLQASTGEIQTSTKEHHAVAMKAQLWVAQVSLENRLWPCIACGVIGALLVVLVVYFRPH